MVTSGPHIQEDSDREWKFARSLLYMDYIGNGGTLPAPLNIIGAPKALFKMIFCRCKSKKDTTGQLYAFYLNNINFLRQINVHIIYCRLTHMVKDVCMIHLVKNHLVCI